MPGAASQSVASRAEWLSARATLAGRRSGRFALIAAGTFVVVASALLLITRSRATPPREAAPPEVRSDTNQLLDSLAFARDALAHADSQVEAAQLASAHVTGNTPGLAPAQRERRDSLQALMTALDQLLDRAANAPLAASYHALAIAPALAGDPRAARLDDSIAVLERRRAALDPTSNTERSFAELTTLVNDAEISLRDVAARRRRAFAREIFRINASTSSSVAADTAGLRRSRERARMSLAVVESSLAAARGHNVAAATRETAAPTRGKAGIPAIAVLMAAMMLALIIGFSMNLFAEIARPTVVTSHEAERAADAPVVAIVRDHRRGAGQRGVDPFRMLYLGLTATGTRTRTVAISGDDRAVVATVGGRLAAAAAADARATLVVDMDADGSSVAGYYDERPEPGFTDAIAGVRLWREVTRPVGASEELSIDVIPGGSVRRDELDADTKRSARSEFKRIRDEYDFCVIVAPTDAAIDLLCSLLDSPAVVVCAELGRTSIEDLQSRSERIRRSGADIHGVAAWDSEIPVLRSRNTLISKMLNV